MPRPLLLQFANPEGYVGKFHSSDFFVSDSILQRNSEHSLFLSSLSDLDISYEAHSEETYEINIVK